MTDRQQQAQKIINDPTHYKVCCCCGSIVTPRPSVCPSCNGYNFDVSIEAVIAQARLLASRAPLSVAPGDLGA